MAIVRVFYRIDGGVTVRRINQEMKQELINQRKVNENVISVLSATENMLKNEVVSMQAQQPLIEEKVLFEELVLKEINDRKLKNKAGQGKVEGKALAGLMFAEIEIYKELDAQKKTVRKKILESKKNEQTILQRVANVDIISKEIERREVLGQTLFQGNTDTEYLDNEESKRQKANIPTRPMLVGATYKDMDESQLPTYDTVTRNKWKPKAGGGVEIDHSVVTRPEKRQILEDTLDAELDKPSPDIKKAMKLQRKLDKKGSYDL